MHAHNISYETYTSANNMFCDVNIQLLAEIEKLLKYPSDTAKSNALVNALDSTLNDETINTWKQAFENSSNFIDAINEQRKDWEYIEESLMKWDEVIKSVKNASNIIDEVNKVKKLCDELKEKK